MNTTANGKKYHIWSLRTTERAFQILIISCKIIKEVFYIRKDLFYMNDNRSKNQPRVRKFPSEPAGEKGPGRASKGGRNKEELLREMGNRLRQIRLEKNWTQDKMAECLGITKAFYGKIERGESSIALEKLALLTETMDIDLNYLITGETIPVLPINFQDVPREKRYSMEQLIKYAVSLASSKEG